MAYTRGGGYVFLTCSGEREYMPEIRPRSTFGKRVKIPVGYVVECRTVARVSCQHIRQDVAIGLRPTVCIGLPSDSVRSSVYGIVLFTGVTLFASD